MGVNVQAAKAERAVRQTGSLMQKAWCRMRGIEFLDLCPGVKRSKTEKIRLQIKDTEYDANGRAVEKTYEDIVVRVERGKYTQLELMKLVFGDKIGTKVTSEGEYITEYRGLGETKEGYGFQIYVNKGFVVWETEAGKVAGTAENTLVDIGGTIMLKREIATGELNLWEAREVINAKRNGRGAICLQLKCVSREIRETSQALIYRMPSLLPKTSIVSADLLLSFSHHEYTAQPILLESLPVQEIFLQRWTRNEQKTVEDVVDFGKSRRMDAHALQEGNSSMASFFGKLIEEKTPLAIAEKPFIVDEKPFVHEEKEKEERKEKRSETMEEVCEMPSEKTKGAEKEKSGIGEWAKERSEIFMGEKTEGAEIAGGRANYSRKAAGAIGEAKFVEKKEESENSERRKISEVKNYFGKKVGEDEKGGSSDGKMKAGERKKSKYHGEKQGMGAGRKMKPKNWMEEKKTAKERKKEKKKKERKENGKKAGKEREKKKREESEKKKAVRKDKENEGKSAEERRKKAEKERERTKRKESEGKKTAHEGKERKGRKSANAASQKNKFRAILLDMDGVVALSENFHRKTFNEVLKKFGIFVNKKEWMRKYAGIGSPKIMKRLFRQHGIDEDAAEWVKKRAEHFKKALQMEKMPSVPGVKKFLKWAKLNGVKVMVVSGGHTQSVSRMLENMGISRIGVVGRDQLKKTKPDPEGYLLAARKLGVSPDECLVFEDSPTGVRAAFGAGMKCIALLTTNRKKRLLKAGFFIRDFRDGRLAKIISLLFGKNYTSYS